MEVHIQKGEIKDLEAIAVIFDAYRVFYQAPSDIEGCKIFLRERILNQQSVIFMATGEDGAVMGFTQLYPSFASVAMKKIWILNDLFVYPDYRKAGIGTALIRSAIELANLDGAARISLSTAKDNPAQLLYERLGFMQSSYKFYNYAVS